MSTRLVVALALVVVATVVAALINRRKSDAPTQPSANVPTQVDRRDFEGQGMKWLIAVFTSRTCDSCEKVTTALMPLASAQVEVQEVPFQRRKDLHDRYGINAVPTTVVAGPDGAVKASWVGAFPTAEIWEAVEAARRSPVTE